MKSTGFKPLRFIISFAILMAMIAGVVFLIVNRGKLGNFDIFSSIFGGSVRIDEKFAFDPHPDNAYAEIDGRMIIASPAGVQMFDKNGADIISVGRSLSQPIITAAGTKAIVWDVGIESVIIIDQDGDVETISVGGPVISLTGASNGWYAVCAEEPGYKGTVTVYSDNSTPIYKWFSAEGYIISAAISHGGSHMAAVTLNKTGSRVVSFLYGNNSITESGAYTSPDKLFFDLAYMSDSKLCLIHDNGLTFLNGNSEPLSEYTFSDEYLKDWSFDGNGYVTLVLGKYRTGNQYRIVTVDSEGREIKSISINTEILSMSAKGKYIAVAYTEKIVIYSYDFNVRGTLEGANGVRGILMCKDGNAIVISSYGAAVFST